MKNIDFIIGESNNIEREIYKSTLFYDELKIKCLKDGEEIYSTNILPNRVSFKKNKKIVLEKIETIKERIGISEYYLNKKTINFFEKLYYIVILLLKNFITKFFIPTQWIIGYRQIGKYDWEYLKISSDKMWADPFIVYENNKYYIFYEELFFKENKGRLCVGELDLKNKDLKNRSVILETDYHLSYPYIFKVNENWYMIPETSENKTIDLYRAEKFPNNWIKEKTLVENIDAVDSSIVFFKNKWYLFTSEKLKGVSHNDELTIYQTIDFKNNSFEKLSKDPVVSNVKYARMAGKLFYKDGNLYRVSQNCSKRYGYKVNIFKIKELEKDIYIEELIGEKEYPHNLKRVIAMHTYNFDKDIEVADFKVLKFDIYSLKRTMIISIKKLKKIIFI